VGSDRGKKLLGKGLPDHFPAIFLRFFGIHGFFTGRITRNRWPGCGTKEEKGSGQGDGYQESPDNIFGFHHVLAVSIIGRLLPFKCYSKDKRWKKAVNGKYDGRPD
jgi:hypothetical protein